MPQNFINESDRIIGGLEKAVEGLEQDISEIKSDVKTLLATYNRNRGITYMISAFVGSIASVFTTIIK